MAFATLQSLGPLAPLAGTVGSRIERRAERRSTQRRPALQVRCMVVQEQWKLPSKELGTSRRDAIFFMTAVSFAANTLLSADTAEAHVTTANIGQQIIDKLKEIVGISKPNSKDAVDKEKAAPPPAAKEKTSAAKEEKQQQPPAQSAKEKAPQPKEEKPQEPPPLDAKEKIAQSNEQKPEQPPTKSKEETPKSPSPLNDKAKPLVNATNQNDK